MSLVPMSSEPSRANDLYQSTPSAMIAGTLHRVSTLFTQVGLPHTPTAAGKGGLERGLARRPSRELISAVSSPQM